MLDHLVLIFRFDGCTSMVLVTLPLKHAIELASPTNKHLLFGFKLCSGKCFG